MSEEQADYITEAREALDMLGKGYNEPSVEIEAPRKVTERRGGKLVEVERSAFIKLYTSFKDELKAIKGEELKVWIYIALSVNRYTKDARPGLRKIASDLNLAINTVRAHVESLELKGLLDVERSEGGSNIYHPADYVSVSKSDTVGVSKNNSTVSTTRRESAQLEELEELETASPLSSESWYKFEKQASEHNLEIWEGRETFRPDHLPLVDWYHSATGQVCKKKKRNDWHRAVNDWTANNLTVDDLQAAYNEDIGWRHAYTSPNQLTDKAIALKAQKSAQSKPSVPVVPIPERKPNPRPANVPAPKIQRSSHGNS